MEMYLRGYNKNQKKLSGLGLVEVLIALVFIATTMILAMSTVSRGLRIAKENEIKDQASGIMLRGLEFGQLDLSSEAGIDISDVKITYTNNSIVFADCFKLDINGDLIPIRRGCDPISDRIDNFSSCTDYLLDIPGSQICNQIIITNIDATSSGGVTNILPDKIRITSIVVYLIEGESKVQKVDTYIKI